MIPFPNKKYNIIYADPAWSYNDKRDKHPRISGGATTHYKTMELEEIKKLPVKDISADNCMLFLWATFPNLQEALDVIKAWVLIIKLWVFHGLKLTKMMVSHFLVLGIIQSLTVKYA